MPAEPLPAPTARHRRHHGNPLAGRFTAKKWWRGQDSNLRRLSRQIYSLIPLAAREPLRKTFRDGETRTGAGERSRTPDRLITSQLLYRLSYASTYLFSNSGGEFYANYLACANISQGVLGIFMPFSSERLDLRSFSIFSTG